MWVFMFFCFRKICIFSRNSVDLDPCAVFRFTNTLETGLRKGLCAPQSHNLQWKAPLHWTVIHCHILQLVWQVLFFASWGASFLKFLFPKEMSCSLEAFFLYNMIRGNPEWFFAMGSRRRFPFQWRGFEAKVPGQAVSCWSRFGVALKSLNCIQSNAGEGCQKLGPSEWRVKVPKQNRFERSQAKAGFEGLQVVLQVWSNYDQILWMREVCVVLWMSDGGRLRCHFGTRTWGNPGSPMFLSPIHWGEKK